MHSPSMERLQKFKAYKNKLNTLIRKSKRKYFFNKFEKVKNNMKQTWQTINDIMGRGKKQPKQNKFKDKQGKFVTNPQDISNKFNDFFVNIGPKLAKNIQNTGKNYFDYLQSPLSTSMYMKPVVEMEIIKIIEQFDPNKSAGYDGIGNFIIKRVSNEIAEPLAMIFNLSITTGVVPGKLKMAKVIPIYKKDDAEVFSNYRPVSVLPCMSKILERLVLGALITLTIIIYLMINNLDLDQITPRTWL